MNHDSDQNEGTGATGACNTLYYDGQCPLCIREINVLSRLNDGSLNLVDIHDDRLTGDSHNADDRGVPAREEMLTVLHLKDASGQWLRGADATVRAWQATPYGPIFRILRWPLIRTGVDLVYGKWSLWRYKRLYGSSPDQ